MKVLNTYKIFIHIQQPVSPPFNKKNLVQMFNICVQLITHPLPSYISPLLLNLSVWDEWDTLNSNYGISGYGFLLEKGPTYPLLTLLCYRPSLCVECVGVDTNMKKRSLTHQSSSSSPVMMIISPALNVNSSSLSASQSQIAWHFCPMGTFF